MCIPHGTTGIVSNGFVKKSRPQKSVKRVSKNEFEKGDPNFIDERKITQKSEDKEDSFFSSLFK